MERRAFLSPRGALLCAGLALLAAALFLWASLLPQGAVAVVEVAGREVLRRELSQVEGAQEFPVQGEGGVELTIQLTRQGARVLSSTCPDQTCVKTGLLTRAGEAAVCLPAQVSLRLEGGGSGADAAVY